MPTQSPHPPASLDDLERRLGELDDPQSALKLGKRSREVLKGLVTAPQQAAVSTISELAERLNVSPSTLSRLAQRLGFSGFGELQAVFRRHVTQGQHFYSRQVSRLLEAPGTDGGMELMTRLAQEEGANLQALLHNIKGPTLGEAAEHLAHAPRVRVHGMRQFASLASFMAYGLGMLRNDVALLDAARHGTADGLAQLASGDVLVVASCFPYTPSVIATAEVAAHRGLHVIAITDAAESPLARLTSAHFVVPNQSLFFSNSMCAFMLLAEGLLSETASRLGDAGLQTLQHHEQLISELDASL